MTRGPLGHALFTAHTRMVDALPALAEPHLNALADIRRYLDTYETSHNEHTHGSGKMAADKRFLEITHKGIKTANLTSPEMKASHSPPDVSLPLFISVVSGTAVVVLVVVIYCTWRCWTSKRDQVSLMSTPEMVRPQYVMNVGGGGGGPIKISQSTPDLIDGHTQGRGSDYVQEERQIGKQHVKTVIKQTTLPTVPQRHQRFQRQLSYKLDITNIEFTIHSMKYREQPRMLGNLKPELYRQKAQDSLPASKESIRVVGSLTFSLAYIADSETLVVSVLRAENLPPKDFSGTSDPYAKIYLLPDRKRKFQTKVHRKTLNPEFNETFAFTVDAKSLMERTLQFSLYDFDRFSRHDLIGVVVVREVGRHLEAANENTLVMDVVNVQQEMVDLGELMLSLCYLPTAGRLTVTIIKARNLKAMDITGTSDPYVKVSLMCQGKRIKKRKTSVKRNTLSPVYNEAIVFDVPQENVEEVSLLIKVIDYDRVGSNELMGCCALGPQYLDAGGRDHWFEMLENPRRPVAQWYTLQENLPTPPAEDTGAIKRQKP